MINSNRIDTEKNMKGKTGDRIVQIILLLIIAGGFAGIAIMMKGNGSRSGSPGGTPGSEPRAMAEIPAGTGPMDKMERTEGMSTIAVEAELVNRQTVNQFIRVNGDVVSEVSVDIYPDIAGKLVESRIKVGSFVRKGEVIAVVDPSVPGVVYSSSPILSTITGTITAINADVGDKVSTASSIAVVGDLSKLSLITYIPERFINYLKTGLNAEVTFESFPGIIFDARVIQLNPVVDTSSRSLEIKLEILNPNSGIRAGMFASMKLITRESKDTVAVSTAAVSTYYEDSIVFIVNDDDTAERRVVTLGLTSDDLTEILSGLSEGEIVVTQGTSSITEGASVRVVNDLGNQEN